MQLRRLTTTTALAAILAVGAGAAPANAAEEQPPARHASSTLSEEDLAYLADKDEFHCTLTIQYPYASHHKDGTINVVGDVTCPVTMKEM